MIDLEDYKRDLKAGKYDNYRELYNELVLDYSRLFEGLKNAGAELFDLRKDYAKLLQDNTRLVELLKQCNNIMPACPKCKGNLRTWERLAYNETTRVGHAEGCKLAKELGDD